LFVGRAGAAGATIGRSVFCRCAPPDKRSYQVDFSQYQALAPNHQPRIPLQQSVEELARGLTAMNFSDPKFRESQFIRLRVLKKLQEQGLINANLEWLQ
jgi:hypothetical protein